MKIRTADSGDLDVVLDLRLAFLCEVRGLDPSEITVQLVSAVVNDVPPLLEDGRSKAGYIINEYVIPSARGRGIGRLLLRSALECAAALGIRQFNLYATDAGYPMYRSEGFAAHDRFMVRTVSIDAP